MNYLVKETHLRTFQLSISGNVVGYVTKAKVGWVGSLEGMADQAHFTGRYARDSSARYVLLCWLQRQSLTHEGFEITFKPGTTKGTVRVLADGQSVGVAVQQGNYWNYDANPIQSKFKTLEATAKRILESALS